MKYKILSAILFVTITNWQSSIYDIQVLPVDGSNSISLSSYANKKILIATISAANPDKTKLIWLNSLQQADTSLRIIVVPASDLGGAGNDTSIATLKTSLSLRYVITKSANVKKNAGSNQHSLFKWLTHVSENTHFDKDVESIDQLFIVSKSGTLYSILDRKVSASVLSQALNQEIK